MSLFLILISLFTEKYRSQSLQDQILSFFTKYLVYLDELLNSGERHHGVVAWFVSTLPLLIIYNLIDYLLSYLNLHLMWLVDLSVLLSVICFRSILKKLISATEQIRTKIKENNHLEDDSHSPQILRTQQVANAIEQAINDAHTYLFAVLFWYGVLPGVNGVILYIIALQINNHWGQDRQTDFGYFSRRMFYYLNWPVYYLTALTFAIVGNFEDALFCWRTQGVKEGESATSRIFFASAAGALGIRLGDPNSPQRLINGLDLGLGELPDLDHLKSTEGLIWRALVVWVIVYALMTLAAHV